MSNVVEVKVNVINQLRLLRQSTFKDILCFLDEDIQNAQRAKAKNVHVDIKSNKITISNDGGILENPQCLFSIAESGWDNEVKETENPFGMGFFSNITVSNYIEVFSGNKHIIFDVDKMINTNDTEIFVEQLEDDYIEGFKLILNNFDFDTADRYRIRERVALLGKYIQELNIYCDGELQEHTELTDGDDSIFQIKVEESDFVGWLALAGDYWYGDNLNIFYKGRLVTKLENSAYLKGDIHVSDRTLTLTSPDRKDIIKDSKYYSFKDKIKEYAKLLCEDSLLNGDEAEVEGFSNAIAYYIDKEEVKNKVKFLTLKAQDEKDLKYIQKIALVKKDKKNVKSFKDYQLYLKSENKTQPESHFEEVEIKEDVVIDVPIAKGIIIQNGGSSYREGYVDRPEIKEKETVEKIGTQIINNEEPVFWINFNEIEQCEFKLNILKHYGLKLIIARNKVEADILRCMKDSDKVIHISELVEKVEVTGVLSNTELNTKEQRALMLFELISRILGFDHNIFSIGDLMVIKSIRVESIDAVSEIIEDSVSVLRNSGTEKVYVDRSIIDMSDLAAETNTEITISDYKFILTNLFTIIENSYLLCDENQTKDEVIQKILLALGQGML
jgi:hypothetical protein